MAWLEKDVPDQSGRTVLVTGGNGGLGYETSRMFAERGARVVIAARNVQKAESARESILKGAPNAVVDLRPLDVSSLASVRAFADAWLANEGPLDILVNNAGVMAIPRTLSADGHEMQFATNHLGHFALTMALMPALLKAPAPRVVNVASMMHWMGALFLDDLDGARQYEPWSRYGQSKLCNLLFTAELDRRLRSAKSKLLCLAAHPGYSATDLQMVAPRASGSSIMATGASIGNAIFAQSAAMGALPTMRAGVDPNAQGGEYYGPWVLGWFGAPELASRSSKARNPELAAALWKVSEELTGLSLAV